MSQDFRSLSFLEVCVLWLEVSYCLCMSLLCQLKASWRCPCPNPWKPCMKMWPYMLKGTLKVWLNYASWDGKIFLDFLGGSNVITRVLKWGGQDGYCHWTQSNDTDQVGYSDLTMEMFVGVCPSLWSPWAVRGAMSWDVKFPIVHMYLYLAK